MYKMQPGSVQPRPVLGGRSGSGLGPFHHRWQRGQDRLHVATGLQPEHRAAVVEQIELDIAAASHQLLLAFTCAPGTGKIAANEVGIDGKKGAADVSREGKRSLPASLGFRRREIVEKDAADPARLLA